MTAKMTRWPLGSVTLENKHLWTREQLQKAGVCAPRLDRIDPRVLHHVHDLLTTAAECVELGRIVIDEAYTDGSELVIVGGVVDGDRFDREIYETNVRALQRAARLELQPWIE